MALPSHIARYTVVQPIAAGGMGEVFLARDEKLDRLVAIKLLREGFDSPDLHQRFEEEARHVAKLTHPNIVTIYEFGTHETRPYIAMEYIAGHSLAEIIKRQLPISVARRVRLIEEVCSGLAHAHKAHLVHRDVKPANLMMTTSGLVKVLDFGIAKLRGTERTQKGMIVGTVNYMSPEQITGQPVDHRSDVFAVGAVLYEILTYEQAFKGDLTTAMFGIVHGHPEPLAKRCPGLDPAFQSVVDRCLAKSPDDRYQDLSQLKRELGKLRRPLEEAEAEDASDTMGPLDVDQTVVVKAAKPSSSLDGKGVGPDTRRALGSALASGEAAMTAGQFESAIRYAEQALALESQNISAHDLMARAVKAHEAARVSAHVRQAREALGGDRLDDARAALDAATAIAPESNTVRELVQQLDQRAADLDRFDRTVVLARERFEARDFTAARDLTETIAHIRPDHSTLKRLRDEIERADAKYRTWLKAELAAIDEIVARQDFNGALARAEAAAAKAPQAHELSARANQIRAAREAVARADEARRRDADEKRRAEEQRAQRIATLLEMARRAGDPPRTRRDAALELVKLDPQHDEAAALLAQLTTEIEAAERQRTLDGLLAAAETLLDQGQLEAADAKAAEVAKARPDDARAMKVRTAVVERRKTQEQTAAAIASADAAASAGRHAEAIAQLEALDTRDPAVRAALDRVRAALDRVRTEAEAEAQRQRRAAAAEAKRRQRAATQARLMAVATDWRAMSGVGAVAVAVLAFWLWPGGPGPTTPGVATPESQTTAMDPAATTNPADAPVNGQTPGNGQTPANTNTSTTTSPGTTNPPAKGTTADTTPARPGTNDRPGDPLPNPLEPPPPVPGPPRVVTAGADVPEPARTRYVGPVYPPRAIADRAQGTVTTEITVGVDGAVTGASVRRSVPGLDAAALAAVRQWRYQPSMKDGQPVVVRMTVDVPFKLPDPVAPETRTADVTTRKDPAPPVKDDTRVEPPPEKPALEKPTPPPPPVKTDEGAVLRQANDAQLRSIMDRFGAAYRGEDLNGMKGAWPDMNRRWESTFRDTFRDYRGLGWDLQKADISYAGDRATAICDVTVTQTDIRRNVTQSQRRSYRFTFERRQTGWTLQNVDFLGIAP